MSTRYAMLAAQPVEHVPRALGATGLHIGQPALNPLDSVHAVEKRLVRLCILHHEFRLPVDGQDQGMTRLPKTIEELHRVPLKVAERPNVISEIEHEGPHEIHIEFDDSMLSGD